MKKITDTVTILLLIGAFGVAFYAGFFGGMLQLGLFALISSAGLAAMFIVGAGAEMGARAKRNTITKSFLAGFISQLAMVIFMIAMMAGVWIGLFPTSSPVVQACYIIFVLVVVIGYCQSVAYTDIVSDAEDEQKKPEE